MAFYGTWKGYSLGEKGELSVPREFRALLQGGVIITRGFGRRIRIYPVETAGKHPFPQIWKVKVNSRGKFVIPAELIRSAAWWRGITWFGMGDYLEIRPQKQSNAAQVIEGVIRTMRREVQMIIGRIVPWKEITLAEILELHRRGIAAEANGDRRVIVLTQSESGNDSSITEVI